MMTRIIALARQLNVVIDDGTEKTVKRTNSLIGFIQNLLAANKYPYFCGKYVELTCFLFVTGGLINCIFLFVKLKIF